MKLKQLNEVMMTGKSVITGRLQTYKAEQTEKAGCNEKFGILVGRIVNEFTVWAPKGAKLDSVKRPGFVDRPGCVVAVIGGDFRVDGKYLRTTGEQVVEVEL